MDGAIDELVVGVIPATPFPPLESDLSFVVLINGDQDIFCVSIVESEFGLVLRRADDSTEGLVDDLGDDDMETNEVLIRTQVDEVDAHVAIDGDAFRGDLRIILIVGIGLVMANHIRFGIAKEAAPFVLRGFLAGEEEEGSDEQSENGKVPFHDYWIMSLWTIRLFSI